MSIPSLIRVSAARTVLDLAGQSAANKKSDDVLARIKEIEAAANEAEWQGINGVVVEFA